MTLCHCGSGQPFIDCCSPILDGSRQAATPEQLMRARYSAFCLQDIAFLGQSLHPDHREDHDEVATRRWASNADWLGLEILSKAQPLASGDTDHVEFVATFREKGVVRKHHEKSEFKRHPCPCGSGKKFKKCCGKG